MIVDHLSRVEKLVVQEEERGIVENFPNKQLFQLSLQSPWYADSVNFLACGIMPPEFTYQQRKKLRTDSRYYIWDDPLLFRRGVICSSKDVYQKVSKARFYKNVMHHHMEHILQEIKQPTKFSSLVFIGLLFSRTILNG